MKYIFATLLFTLLFAGTASARRFQAGVRGGINTAQHDFDPVRIGSSVIRAGSARIGYETGFVLRLNLSKHLHLQSELNYSFVNYNFRIGGLYDRDVRLRTERFEIPVELGFQFGAFRLFGGALFRVADSERSSVPRLLRVDFNDEKIGIVSGIGLNIRKFFLDFRVSGVPRSHVWETFTSDGTTQRVKVSRNIVYGGSIGFFF